MFIHKRKKKKKKSGRWEQTNHLPQAKLYLMKTMQNVRFNNELSFSKDPTKSHILPSLKNLNVFIDPEGILRLDGRITASE